ncbi:hypothetical protein O6H91_07G043800 [Diphasiastrum complanatum]|uniref:Uncharacterized protein n=3 Tax=Diphasiastrum complanatum TaxID=34168 RepID=A0ACC2D4L5_DIPCM|nr:hypothetical protein O6H91_07G043800 [Diphasiastrum complanatum]KAJ7549178.1 hypothetical protein O6H91_07G043800 [Diphasiastrum complanatum]KAJ7549179.1 hypothetical protein O6H91_07G043800 [Diphasiastrum complanatum]
MAPKVRAKPLPQQQLGVGQPPLAAVAPVASSMDDLFASLARNVKSNNHKQIVKVADQILAVAPQDIEALQCKVVALIQVGNISEALTTIDSVSKEVVDHRFHKAYCLYRQNKLGEALSTLMGLERSSNVLQLEAQILYRKGDLDACIASYEKLLQKFKIDSDEVKTNVLAAYIAGGRSSEVLALMDAMNVSPKSSFDLAYNVACVLLDKEDYTKAEELLLLARRVGQEILIEEDYNEEELEDELAPISAQLAYVQQAQGRLTESMEGYSKLLKRNPADAPSVAVALSNLAAARGSKEVSDSLKRFDKVLELKGGGRRLQFVEGLEQKLSAKQKEAIIYNYFLLLLHSNRLNQAREVVPALLETFPESDMPALLHASLLLKEGKLHKAEDILGQFTEKHPGSSRKALLLRAQAAASAGHLLRAADDINQIDDLRFKPAVLATVVALKEQGGDISGAEAVFDAAIEYWDSHMGEDKDTLELLIKEAAAFKLKHQKLQASAELFKHLSKSSSSEVRAGALIGLVCSTAVTDVGIAEMYEQQLPPLPGLSGVDAAALEQSFSASSSSVKREQTGELASLQQKSVDVHADKRKNKRKRKRKPRYPKNFDPANPGPPPDPERWLPKRERSTFRPKKKDKRAAQVRGSQGSVVRDKPGDFSSVAANGPGSAVHSKPGNSSGTKGSSTATSTSDGKSAPSTAQKSRKKGRR